MGLDMFVFYRDAAHGIEMPQVDFEGSEMVDAEIAYFRKHANLHGWMEKLYREKGGQAESFNCVNLRLTAEDLDRLEKDVEADALPHTTGFFFGASTEEDMRRTRFMIRDAREKIAAGHAVYYTSWW